MSCCCIWDVVDGLSRNYCVLHRICLSTTWRNVTWFPWITQANEHFSLKLCSWACVTCKLGQVDHIVSRRIRWNTATNSFSKAVVGGILLLTIYPEIKRDVVSCLCLYESVLQSIKTKTTSAVMSLSMTAYDISLDPSSNNIFSMEFFEGKA